MSTKTEISAPAHAPARGQPQARSSRAGWLVLLALIAVGGVGGAWWVLHERKGDHHSPAPAVSSESEHEESPGTNAPLKVEVVHPQKGGIIRTSTQPGSVHWFEMAELFAKVSGYLKEQSVDIGSPVKEGELLAVIDNPEVIKEADRDAAALAEAKAAVKLAEARVRTAIADLDTAKASVKKAEADILRYTSARKYRAKELERYRGLYAQQAVPKQLVDEYEDHYEAAVSAERSAEAEVDAAKARLESAEAMVAQAEADLAEAKEKVNVAESTWAKAKVFVDYTRIVSPYTGVVTLRSFHRGAFIRAAEGGGDTPILSVARTDKVRVVTYVPDRDVPYVDVGDKARLTLDALPGEVFEGTVSRFAEVEDPQTRTMRTEVDLPNPNDRLRDGMYGDLTIILDQSAQSLTIPTACLVGKSGSGKATVFVIKDGRVHETPVKTGIDTGQRIEIVEGLKPEDNVVMNPGQVTDGEAAEPVQPSTPVAAKGH
jgi:RND family efflux transporter MFP subunit